MNKKLLNRKIKDFDGKKYLRKNGVVWGCFFIITLAFIGLDPENETYLYLFCGLLAATIIYSMVSAKTATKEVTIKEFLKKIENQREDFKITSLKAKGLSDDEIKEVLKIKINKDDLDDKENEDDGNKDYTTSYTRTGFIITTIISIVIGFVSESVLAGIFVFGFCVICILPLFHAIGSSKQVKYNVENNLPKQLDYLTEHGINIEEQYLSNSGTGIIIDRESGNLAIVQSNNVNTEPVIIPFEMVMKCEFYENKEQRIKESPTGEIGVAFDNAYLKERGKYDERKIETIVTEMGMILSVVFDRIETMKIPYYAGSCNENILFNTKVDIMNAVDNVKSIIGLSSKSNELVKAAENIVEKGKVLSRIYDIKAKMQTDELISKKDIDFLLENDDELDLGEENKDKIIESLKGVQDALEESIPKDSSDYKKMNKICDDIKKMMAKKKFMRSDQALNHNLNIELKKLYDKYYQE